MLLFFPLIAKIIYPSHEKSENNLSTGFLEKYLTSVIKNMASGETSAQCCRTHSLFNFVLWSLVSLYFSMKSTASLPSSQQSLHLMPSHCVSLAKDLAWECSIGAWVGKSADKTRGWHLTPYQEPWGNKVNLAKSLSELTGSLKSMWLGVLLDVRGTIDFAKSNMKFSSDELPKKKGFTKQPDTIG